MPEGECAKASRFKAGRAYSSDIDLQKGGEQYENSSHVSHGFAEVGTRRTLPGFNYVSADFG
jgi:hypothetical protein